jgi:hypothetical protein
MTKKLPLQKQVKNSFFSSLTNGVHYKIAGSLLRKLDPDISLKSKMLSMMASAVFRMRFIQSNF